MLGLKVKIPTKDIDYDISFVENVFDFIGEKLNKNSKKLFVIDGNVFEIYKDTILQSLEKIDAYYIILKAGEENKNISQVFFIIDNLLEKKLNRNDYLIALGGGVCGDITGFAAGLYKRGLKLIQIPTTLLAMLDSSVGGKTGVDYKSYKNLVGIFYNPNMVLIDKKFLLTLDKDNILGGFFEGLKHSILTSKKDFFEFMEFYEKLQKKELDLLDNLIKKNISFKLNVVSKDPFETLGKRKILNYGHTFGHALETYKNFELGHGICVGFGIIFANILSYNLKILKEETLQEINSNIISYLKDYDIGELDFEKIFSYMQKDKKNISEEIQFILISDYGKTILQEVTKNDLKTSFNLFQKTIKG